MGLGLTVAQGVIVRHGGWIDVENMPRGGARVTVWLPASKPEPSSAPMPAAQSELDPGTRPRTAWSDEDAPAEPTDAAAEPGSDRGVSDQPDEGNSRSGKRSADLGDADPKSRSASILVLEDEAAVRASLVEALSRAGYKVETALDGLSGLAKLDGERFDVVVTDLAL